MAPIEPIANFSYKKSLLSLHIKTKVVHHVPRMKISFWHMTCDVWHVTAWKTFFTPGWLGLSSSRRKKMHLKQICNSQVCVKILPRDINVCWTQTHVISAPQKYMARTVTIHYKVHSRNKIWNIMWSATNCPLDGSEFGLGRRVLPISVAKATYGIWRPPVH